MKQKIECAAALVLIILLASCATVASEFSALFPKKEGWSSLTAESEKSFSLGSIEIDSAASWDSLEKEAAGLLPLLLLERGIALTEGGDYSVSAKVIEREFAEGWQTKRSLSAEIRIFRSGEESSVPLAAGRAMASGEKSASSSKVLSRLLRGALRRALKNFDATAREAVEALPPEDAP
jgi:hypothetical protein